MICCFKGRFRVTSPRGDRVLNGKKEFHKGIDLVGIDDTTVYSICDGTVRTGYEAGGAGYYMVVTMADGRRVFYMHLAKFLVKKGDKVVTGQALGVMGATGAVTGAHTHLELRPRGTTMDSLDIIQFTGLTNKVGIYEYKPKEDILAEDINVLVKAGIINTPDYWKKNACRLEFVDTLIHKMAEYVKS